MPMHDETVVCVEGGWSSSMGIAHPVAAFIRWRDARFEILRAAADNVTWQSPEHVTAVAVAAGGGADDRAAERGTP